MKSRYLVSGVAFVLALMSCATKEAAVTEQGPLHDSNSAVAASSGETAPERERPSEAPTPQTSGSRERASVNATLPAQYVIQAGDTFRGIAASPGIYWNENLWKLIWQVNTNKIPDPDFIRIGIILTIPPLQGETREGMWEPGVRYDNPF
jgi:nucleoid-associated protein YgaU